MKTIHIIPFVLALALFAVVRPVAAQGTAFTYQGRLNGSNGPASGLFDMTFRVFSVASGGGQVGNTTTTNGVGVSTGLFTVRLDPGAGVFTGADRWLEIAVKTNLAPTFTTLAPRQPLTPAPYAIMSGTASNLLGNLPAAQLSGTLPSAQLGGIYSGALTLNNNANNFSGSFSGNGGGMTNVNAALLNGLNATNFWRLGGNNAAAGQFLGSTNNQPMELRVNGVRAMRLEPAVNDANHSNIVNVVNGSPMNFAAPGVYGAAIGGGAGKYFGIAYSNSVTGNFGAVAGGLGNTAGGEAATVPGGELNSAIGAHSMASGFRAKANHQGVFAWADSQNADFASTANDQFLIRAQGGVGINTNNSAGAALNLAVAPGKSLQFRNDGGLVPGINVATTGGNPGIMRFRNSMEIWPSDDTTRAGYLDIRATNGAPMISLPAVGNAYFQNGNVGIGISSPSAKLEVAGQIKITGGSPGAGKLLLSDSNGLASWQSPSALSIFFGQNYSVLIPDVIDNTAYIEIDGVMQDNVVVINGPGLDIQRIIGFVGTNSNDQPGPNMEYPFVFEYSGAYSNALQTWFLQYSTNHTYVHSMSLLVKNLAGTEIGRWNLFEMACTQIEPGTDGRKRYTLQHTLPPNNNFGYERQFTTPANESQNPATDLYLIEIDGVAQGGYPTTQIDYTNRTVTLVFDYTEAGGVYDWTKDTAEGLPVKKNMSVITEVNGTEVSRRNFFEVFPISFQYITGFGQVDKLKEKVVLAFGYWRDA